MEGSHNFSYSLNETTIATYSVSTLNGLLQPGMPGVWANNQPKENTSHAMNTMFYVREQTG